MEDAPVTKLDCPICGEGQIVFNIQLFLKGACFSCPSCKASISLPEQSKEIIEKTVNDLDRMKKDHLENKNSEIVEIK